jgi:hypothetical protein
MLHLSTHHFTYMQVRTPPGYALYSIKSVYLVIFLSSAHKSIRYSTLTADPALLMSKYSNQSMEALEGQHACTKYDVQQHALASLTTIGTCRFTGSKIPLARLRL